MEPIFKALSDGTRRDLLDRLRERDGQTLSDLEAVSDLSRFGVMKHLAVLEAAGLIITRKAGRFKYHYLNAAPLQEAIDRWIEPLTRRPLARAVLDLKHNLEGEKPMTTMTETRPDFVLETYIRTTPEKLWNALTDGAVTRLYYFGTAIEGEIEAGANYRYAGDDGAALLSGQIISADPPRRLEMTFQPHWMGPNAGPSRNVYEIEAAGELTKLTILHFDLPEGQDGVKQGWAKIVASLKSLLETGEALDIPPR